MPDSIKIASTSNHEFCTPLLTLYISILEQNSAADFEFFIIDDGLEPLDYHYLNVLCQQYGNCLRITFLRIDPAGYAKAATNARIIQAAYYRIDLPETLREQQRLLYLDCDMVCHGDLRPLWQQDLQGNIIGAVEDAGYVEARLDKMHVPHQNKRYFNSGLMLIDMSHWRQAKISQQTKTFIAENTDRLRYHDQDALNAILADRWLPLHPKYNAQSRLLWREQQHSDPTEERRNEAARQNPVLLHYSGYRKPWNPTDHHPAAAAFNAYQPLVRKLKLKAFNQRPQRNAKKA
ncbi:glycosyltransferase family 8 protein [Loigolactobacillus jiayinensis]|uniref:Glycosyltransferase family 8 protein n=1 Tax=Loigolactobacillus jiayinensis TaxID=2486016 RepID=A0ABW1RBU8_9LACO|nr:glycosyltransferase family 8 protein [Loigolactobacillus jiayinensis]